MKQDRLHVGTVSSRRDLLKGAAAAAGALAFQVGSARAQTTSQYPNAIKMVAICFKRPDLTNDQYYQYWTYCHAPYVSEQLAVLDCFQYVQNHTQYDALTAQICTSRGEAAPAAGGITECWFPSDQDLTAKTLTPPGVLANANMVVDEHNFIDTPNSSYFMSYEYVLLDE
jgi:hypothetical protein